MENSKLAEIATPSEIASVLQSDEGRQALEYFLNNFADHGIFNDGNYPRTNKLLQKSLHETCKSTAHLVEESGLS